MYMIQRVLEIHIVTCCIEDKVLKFSEAEN